MADVDVILRRHERMRSSRASEVESVWRECFDLTFPLRGNGISGEVDSLAGKQHKQAEILDSTAPDALNVLASNLMGGLTPSNSLWFALDVGNETAEERAWLDASARLLWENIHLSNFDADGFETALDICAAGMGALFVDEDRERGGLVFEQWPLAECFFASTRTDGRIDIVHRRYKLTAEAAEIAFGRDKLPECIRRKLEGERPQPEAEFDFLHVIQPRAPHVVNARLSKNLPIASLHVELSSKTTVREGGYHEMPVIVPRWQRAPGSVYAVGPMYAALPDVRQLNQLKGFELAGADVAIAGMWLGIDDGVLNPRTVRLGPRKIIVAADKDSLTPLQTGANFALSDSMVTKLQASIRKTLMADQLPPADGPVKTAYEYSVRVDMIRKLLGPAWGRLQADYLGPLIERCFGLAYRAGVFDPPPQSLQGRNFSVRYVSPMARAQRMDEVGAIQQVVNSAMAVAEVAPEVLDEIDFSKVLELTIEGTGAPGSIKRSAEDVRQLREERARAQQQAQQQQMGMQAQAAGMEEAARTAAAAG